MATETAAKKTTAAVQVKALEERVRKLETYIKTFDMFLTSSNSYSPPSLRELAADIQ